MLHEALCLWCNRPFARRRSGGSRQMFCGPSHRTSFHTAARRWAERAIASGVLTVAELQNGTAAAYTLARGHEAGPESSGKGKRGSQRAGAVWSGDGCITRSR